MNLLEELALARLPRHRAMLRSRARMRALRSLPSGVRRALYRGDRLYCVVCESRLRRFLPFGPIEEEWCPVCASMSRHRLLWHVLDRLHVLDRTAGRMLHLAPEPGLERRLRSRIALRYTTADLHDPRVDDRVDVTAMPYPDRTFDLVLCSHVLEHVPDDGAAMREIARVLKPDGTAVVMVPFHDDVVTDEDPAVADPAEREARFGQHDHVRYYGRDIVGRLEAADLRVQVVRGEDVLPPEGLEREAVRARETVFVCTGPG